MTVQHHDITYWSVAGEQIVTLWLALDNVTDETGAVEYVKGSHRWGEHFRAVSFNPEEQYEDDLPPGTYSSIHAPRLSAPSKASIQR